MSGHRRFGELRHKSAAAELREQLRREPDAAIAEAAKETCPECGSHDLVNELRCGRGDLDAPDPSGFGHFVVCRSSVPRVAARGRTWPLRAGDE